MQSNDELYLKAYHSLMHDLYNAAIKYVFHKPFIYSLLVTSLTISQQQGCKFQHHISGRCGQWCGLGTDGHSQKALTSLFPVLINSPLSHFSIINCYFTPFLTCICFLFCFSFRRSGSQIGTFSPSHCFPSSPHLTHPSSFIYLIVSLCHLISLCYCHRFAPLRPRSF